MTATLPAQGPRPRYPSIISPWVDTLAIGGLSLVAFIPLLLSGREDLVIVSAGTQAWIAALVNMPHFLASYRMVWISVSLHPSPTRERTHISLMV